LVEQKPEKLLVGGSSPFLVNKFIFKKRMAEWFKATACKVVVVTRRGFKSYSSQNFVVA
jgi:hypothetical protein